MNQRTLLICALLLGCPAAGAEDVLLSRSLGSDGAQRLAAAAEAHARGEGIAVTLAVRDASGALIFLKRMDGAPNASVAIAQAKAKTAADWGLDSGAFQGWLRDGDLRLLSLPDNVLIEGGLAIKHGGATIGAIGVSGGSSEQDVRIAAAGVAALERTSR